MQRKISRRALLAGSLLAGVGAAGLALVGCGEDDPDPSQRQPSAQRADDQPQPAQQSAVASSDQLALQPSEAEQNAAGALSPPSVATLVDPLEWRERFHWRKLRDAPGRPAQPQRGGELTVHAPRPYGNDWSPLRSRYGTAQTSLLPLFYSQLVELAADDRIHAHRNTIAGDLAEAWETPDPYTISFTVRPDVVWPALEPLEARALSVEDVRATHETYRTTQADPSADPTQSPPYRDVERIELDAARRSVTFRLAAPNAALLSQMTSPWHVILREEIVSDRAMWNLAAAPAGTGPFVLKNSDAFGLASWEAERNPTYFKRDERGVQLPYLDSLRGQASGAVRSAASSDEWLLLNWEYDSGPDQLSLPTPELWRPAIDARPGSVTQVSPPTPGVAPTLHFKSLREPPFDDARVRTAISRSIDRELLAHWLYNGLAAPDCGQNWTFVADPSSEWGFREWPWSLDELGESFLPDAQAARQLLAAAGYTAEQPLSIQIDAPPAEGAWQFAIPEHEPIIEVVERGLRESLGGAADVQRAPRTVTRENQGEITAYSTGLNENANILFSASWPFGYAVDPDDLIMEQMHSEGRSNVGIADAALDALVEAQRRELDPLKRSDLLEQIRRREAEEVWRLHLVNPYGLSVRREYVFDKVDTYFAKKIEQRPRQLERVWRVDAPA